MFHLTADNYHHSWVHFFCLRFQNAPQAECVTAVDETDYPINEPPPFGSIRLSLEINYLRLQREVHVIIYHGDIR